MVRGWLDILAACLYLARCCTVKDGARKDSRGCGRHVRRFFFLRIDANLRAFRFLLARLYLDSLVDKRTVKDVKATLAKLLKGAAALDGAYSDALTRIEG